jgi:hypothetical protein
MDLDAPFDLGPYKPADTVPIEQMVLAGMPVPVHLVLELATLLRQVDLHATAAKLERSWAREENRVSLDTDDRKALLHVLLEGPRQELAGLRAVLLRQQLWQHAEGL